MTAKELEDKIQNIIKTEKKPWVAKASHLTTGNSVYIIYPDGSIKVPQPVGPGKSEMLQLQMNMPMKKWAGEASLASILLDIAKIDFLFLFGKVFEDKDFF